MVGLCRESSIVINYQSPWFFITFYRYCHFSTFEYNFIGIVFGVYYSRKFNVSSTKLMLACYKIEEFAMWSFYRVVLCGLPYFVTIRIIIVPIFYLIFKEHAVSHFSEIFCIGGNNLCRKFAQILSKGKLIME